MGLLDILNGMQNGPRGPGTSSKNADKGGMSPITMAILALLAYKAMKHMTGGSAEAPAGGGGAKLDQASLPGGGGGGLGDILGSVLGGGSAGSGNTGGLGDLLKGGLGGLGGILAGGAAGGAAGSVLGGGLNDLLKQLQEGGQTDAADSWVAKGPNKDIAPNDLGAALGADQINTMMQSSGLSRQELLEGLSQVLPGMVDQLTPDGRMPSADELRRLL
jgi:uncharacterized protein YidB (DUF937 family)